MAQPGLNRCILKKSLLLVNSSRQKTPKPKRFATLHYQSVLKNDSNRHFTKKGIKSNGCGGVNLNYCTASTNKRSIFSTENGETIIRSSYSDISDDNRPLGEFILSRLEKYKDLTLLVDNPTGRTYTGAQFRDHVMRVTSALYRQGFRKGDVVALTGTNSVEYGIVCIALCLIGVVTSTANPAFTAGELARQLKQSRACAVFSSQSNVGVLREALATDKELQDRVKTVFTLDGSVNGCQPLQTLLEDDGKGFPENVNFDTDSDTCFLPYSSGTTGLPKGVMLTNKNILMNLLQGENGQRRYVPGETVKLGLLPLFHIYGFYVLISSLTQGCKLVVHPNFEPESFLTSIQRYKINHANIVPPISLFMAKHPIIDKFDLSSLEEIVTGAAPMGGTISRELENRLNIRVLQGYGLTETSPLLTHDERPCNHRHGTVGKLIPNTFAKVKDPMTGKPLSVGETGELLFKGPQIMKGYFNNPEATADTVRDGWLHSGDIGMIDADGYFVISDRLKELIKYKGFQIAPAELEALLCSHPGIQDAAVVGLKAGEDLGEVPRAFVVTKPDAKLSDTDITEFVKENVASYKQLRGGVEFIAEIPKTASGKILRRNLKS